jgi:hypothetical protein
MQASFEEAGRTAMRKHYRQGDVLIRETWSREVSGMNKVGIVRGRFVLARGEATGHAHTIDARTAKLYRGVDGRFYLHVEGAGVVEHEEHAPIALPGGFYEVIRQREYSPRASRHVAD